MVKIKKLNKESVSRVIELSLGIFKPRDGRNNSYHDHSKWQNYLDEGGILLGAFVDRVLVGYLIARREKGKNLHIWMGGVKKRFRRRGIMTQLLKSLKPRVIRLGCQRLTVNTYEEKFPAMFALLKKEGFKIWKTKKITWERKLIDKSFFVINLDK